MGAVFEKVWQWGRELGELLDQAPALGGSFLTSAIRDTMVRYLNEFSGTDVIPYIAYHASNLSISTLAKRLSLMGSSIRQISSGLLLGVMAIGGAKDVASIVALGCIRGIRKAIRHGSIDVPDTYQLDVVEGLFSANAQLLDDHRLQSLKYKFTELHPDFTLAPDASVYV